MPKIDGRKDTRTEYDPEDLLFDQGGFCNTRRPQGRCVIRGCGHVVKAGETFAWVVQRGGYDERRPKRAGVVCFKHQHGIRDAWGYDANALDPPF